MMEEQSSGAGAAVGTDDAIAAEAEMHQRELAEMTAKVGNPKPKEEDKAEKPEDADGADPKPKNGTPGKKLDTARCPLCKGTRVPAKHGTRYATEGVTRYRQCSECGQRFTTFTPWIQGKPGEPATPGKEDIVG